MKALTFQGIHRILYETVPDPAIRAPRDAIVQVALAGICGSDLHVYHGRERGLDCGTVMGHEFAGRIVETGSAVQKLNPGMLVASPFTSNCGTCYFCKIGLTSRCEHGQLFGWVEAGEGLHGAQAEFVRVPLADSTLVPLPAGTPLVRGLMLGDILSTGYFCAKQAGVSAGGTYAVIGCGPVGLMAAIAARELGADEIYAIDGVPERLALAETFGAQALDFQSADVVEVILAATQGRGVDGVLEAAGSRAAGRLGYELVRPGGTISVVGVHTEGDFAFSPAEAYDKNITYRVGRCPARHFMEHLLPLIQSNRYALENIVSHTLPLSQGAQGYALFDLKKEQCTKVVLKPS